MKKLFILLFLSGWLMACDKETLNTVPSIVFPSPECIEYVAEEGGTFTITMQSPAFINGLVVNTSPYPAPWLPVGDQNNPYPVEYTSKWYAIRQTDGFVVEVEMQPFSERRSVSISLASLLNSASAPAAVVVRGIPKAEWEEQEEQ